MKKTEDVKNFLKAFKVEERGNGYYIRFRKSKYNKFWADDFYDITKLEDESCERLSDFEFLISKNEFERLYKMYMDKLYDRHI